MAEIWFYTPSGIVSNVVSFVTRGKFSHVSIMHSVADLAVVTEANAIKGVWCSPISRVRKPQHKICVSIDDSWTTRWLVSKWGVQYGWIDALAFTVPSYQKEVDRRGVICTELVGLFLLDAARDPSAKAEIPEGWLRRLADVPLARLSPSKLADVLV